jgi:hypothetical protein
MAKRKWLRVIKTGAILGWNPAMAKNPKVEEVMLDMTKPQSKPASEPKASKGKTRKPPMKPLVADSEEELDKLLEGIDAGDEIS